MSKSLEDLKSAFAGESQANRKYQAFAKKADQEGHAQVAKLFRAAAAAEAIHAQNHLKAMDGILSTVENLQVAITGEHYEVVEMYPPMLSDAETEGHSKAARTFNWALEVEKIHEGLFKDALENLGEDSSLEDYYVCPVCGFTHEGPFNDKCPVCGAPGEKFERIA